MVKVPAEGTRHLKPGSCTEPKCPTLGTPCGTQSPSFSAAQGLGGDRRASRSPQLLPGPGLCLGHPSSAPAFPNTKRGGRWWPGVGMHGGDTLRDTGMVDTGPWTLVPTQRPGLAWWTPRTWAVILGPRGSVGCEDCAPLVGGDDDMGEPCVGQKVRGNPWTFLPISL